MAAVCALLGLATHKVDTNALPSKVALVSLSKEEMMESLNTIITMKSVPVGKTLSSPGSVFMEAQGGNSVFRSMPKFITVKKEADIPLKVLGKEECEQVLKDCRKDHLERISKTLDLPLFEQGEYNRTTKRYRKLPFNADKLRENIKKCMTKGAVPKKKQEMSQPPLTDDERSSIVRQFTRAATQQGLSGFGSYKVILEKCNITDINVFTKELNVQKQLGLKTYEELFRRSSA